MLVWKPMRVKGTLSGVVLLISPDGGTALVRSPATSVRGRSRCAEAAWRSVNSSETCFLIPVDEYGPVG